MPYIDHEQRLSTEIRVNFGDELTSEQLWTIVKLCKRVRLRCRNNAAFNAAFNRIFKFCGATFTQVQKKKRDGSTYPGLQIKINGVVYEQDEEDYED